jgi:prepilin-type N-terminal cleavage/methylation domain-containing protein
MGPAIHEVTMQNRRSGFTLIEILIVMAIMGIVAMMALPKMGNMNDRNQMRSAKDGIAAKLAAARAAAIATGRPSKFYVEGDSMRMTVFTGATESAKGTNVNLYRQFGVKVISANLSIVFDGRGMTSNAGNIVKFTRNALTDSLCISPIGLVNRHGCAK